MGLMLGALLASNAALATTMRLAPHEELVAAAELIVAGTAGAPESFWQDGRIYTRWPVAVSRKLKGESAAVIDVLALGGVVNDIGQHVSGAPKLEEGRRYVLYLARGAGGFFPIGMWQGVLEVVTLADGTERLSRNAGGARLVGPGVGLPADVDSLERAIRSQRR